MQNDLVEAVAAFMWRQEAVRAAPNVVRLRTPEAFAAKSSKTRERWLDQSRAAIPIAAEYFARVADKLAEDAWNEANRQGQNAACASGRNYGCRSVAAAIRAAGSATPEQWAIVWGQLT